MNLEVGSKTKYGTVLAITSQEYPHIYFITETGTYSIWDVVE